MAERNMQWKKLIKVTVMPREECKKGTDAQNHMDHDFGQAPTQGRCVNMAVPDGSFRFASNRRENEGHQQ